MRARWLCGRAVGAGLVLGLLAPAAAAQDNSLRRRASAAATTQPARAGGAAPAAVMAAPAAVRPAERAAPRGARARTNEVLLAASPIAVAPPDPEQIEVERLITIIVRESKTATSDSKLESKKDWSLDTALEKWIRYSDSDGIVPAKFTAGTPAVRFEHKDDYGTNGKYDRKDELTTRITARVIDVKPNGNLVLEARKSIRIDDEGYTITLTGVCRAEDVTPQNTVLSTQIADPEITVQHTGAVRDATRRGWAKRALDFLRPF